MKNGPFKVIYLLLTTTAILACAAPFLIILIGTDALQVSSMIIIAYLIFSFTFVLSCAVIVFRLISRNDHEN